MSSRKVNSFGGAGTGGESRGQALLLPAPHFLPEVNIPAVVSCARGGTRLPEPGAASPSPHFMLPFSEGLEFGVFTLWVPGWDNMAVTFRVRLEAPSNLPTDVLRWQLKQGHISRPLDSGRKAGAVPPVGGCSGKGAGTLSCLLGITRQGWELGISLPLCREEGVARETPPGLLAASNMAAFIVMIHHV